MMKYLLLLIFFLFPVFILAQEYDDVAVVMNTNNPESILVGEYFQERNNIPDVNMIYVEMPGTEVIDSLQLVTIIENIKIQLEVNPTSDEIDYVVTTMGCPQVVSPYSHGNPDITKRSFEIFVAFLTSEYTSYNYYRGESEAFSFLEYGYRIVSRLEAGTLEGTYRMINRGGPQQIDINNKIVLDHYAPFTGGNSFIMPFIIDQMVETEDLLNQLGINTILDTLINQYSEDETLLSYYFVGHGDDGVPVSPFVEKTQEFGILRNFGSALKSNFGSVLTVYDFLEARCHAAMGHHTYFYIGTFNPVVFHENYFNGDMQMNIGESFYSALGLTSPMTLFGDPKSRVVSLSYVNDSVISSTVNIFPLPAREVINIHFEDGKERVLHFYNSNGKRIFSKSIMEQKNVIEISDIPVGVFYILIQEDDKTEIRKILKIK